MKKTEYDNVTESNCVCVCARAHYFKLSGLRGTFSREEIFSQELNDK